MTPSEDDRLGCLVMMGFLFGAAGGAAWGWSSHGFWGALVGILGGGLFGPVLVAAPIVMCHAAVAFVRRRPDRPK